VVAGRAVDSAAVAREDGMMSLADTVTLGRALLSPVFFGVFVLTQTGGSGARNGALIVLLVIFAAIELSDILDGFLARGTRSVSDLGKILDPFADSVSRLTYFVCFAAAGIMPLWVLMAVIYRDTGVALARILAARSGTVMAARLTGKLKAWVYALAGVSGMARLCARSDLLIPGGDSTILALLSGWLFAACGVVAAGSLIDYLIPVLGKRKSRPEQ
jgi:CDP-diacylglycerol---glycerol-3-phosphate 3-phosphatidyltransferase